MKLYPQVCDFLLETRDIGPFPAAALEMNVAKIKLKALLHVPQPDEQSSSQTPVRFSVETSIGDGADRMKLHCLEQAKDVRPVEDSKVIGLSVWFGVGSAFAKHVANDSLGKIIGDLSRVEELLRSLKETPEGFAHLNAQQADKVSNIINEANTAITTANSALRWTVPRDRDTGRFIFWHSPPSANS